MRRKKMIFKTLISLFISYQSMAQKDGSYSFDSCKARWKINVTSINVQSQPYTKDSVTVFAFIGKNAYNFPIRFLDSLLQHKKYASDNDMRKVIKRFDVHVPKSIYHE